MSRWSLVVPAAVSILVASLSGRAFAAGAAIAPPAILPSIGALTATDPAPASASAPAPVSPDVAPGAGPIAKLAHLYEKLRAEQMMRAAEGGPRNATVRDPARDRDATSLGVVSPRLSGVGAALGVGGVACLGIPLVSKFGKELPIKLGPMGALGGGGIAIRGRW